jgi:hypothetical protein
MLAGAAHLAGKWGPKWPREAERQCKGSEFTLICRAIFLNDLAGLRFAFRLAEPHLNSRGTLQSVGEVLSILPAVMISVDNPRPERLHTCGSLGPPRTAASVSAQV